MNNLIERRNQLLSEAQCFALEGSLTGERKTQFESRMADIEAVEKLIEAEQRARKIEASASDPIRPSVVSVSDDDRRAGERRALTEYVRFGKVSDEARAFARTVETRDIGTTVGGSINVNGGLLVPQSFDNMLFTAQKAWGQVASIVRTKVTDTGSTIKVAGADDTANMLTVIGEDTTVSETDPSLNGILSSTDVCTTGLITVSFAELQDSAFDLDSFIRDSFGARYWRGVSSMITNGSSTTNVASLVAPLTLSSGALSAATAGAVTGKTYVAGSESAIAFADLAGIYGSLDPAYLPGAKWMVNSAIRAKLLTIVDNYGRPIFTIGGAGAGSTQQTGLLDAIFGKEVVYNQYLPSVAANNVPLTFGDHAAYYTFRQVRGDLSILRLNERYADKGMVGFIGYARIGGYVNPLGTASPVLGLQIQ